MTFLHTIKQPASIHHKISKHILLFLSLLISGISFAQPADFHFKTYAEKRIYIQAFLSRFVPNTTEKVIDTLSSYQARARSAGDSEMVTELNVFLLEMQLHLHAATPDNLSDAAEIVGYARGKDMKYVEADALTMLGRCYESIGQINMAIEQYIAAYEIYKNFSGREYPGKQQYLYMLAEKFGRLNDDELALRYLLSALRTENPTDYDMYCAMFNGAGLSYRNMKKYDSAIYYFTKAYEYATKTKQSPYEGIAIGNIGITYFLQNKYDLALPLLRRDINTSLSTHQLKNAIGSMSVLANIYTLRHQYDSASGILDSAQSIFWRHNFWRERKLGLQLYKQLYLISSATGQLRRALSYADTTLMLYDSLAAETNTSALAKAHDQLEYTRHKLEAEQLQNRIKSAQIEISKNRIIITFSIAGVAILLIVLLSIFRLNKKINAQKTELENLNDVKNKLFSVIGHDLRTPVNSLVSFTQLLEHGSIPPDKLNKYASALKDNLGHTAELMENLLNWARSQMQGYKPVFERFDIGEIAHQAVGLLSTEADKKNLTVKDNIQKDSIVFADVNMSSLIIRNLVSNAVKFTPEGGTITLWNEVRGDHIYIKIKDTGIGIPADAVAQFNNSDLSQPLGTTRGTNNEKGTGLGLLLCKNFASLMHGKLIVESEQVKGSTFTLSLPMNG